MAKRTSGRKRTGRLYWTKSGWRARLTVEIDGETVRKSFDLQTTDRAVARVKLRRLLAEPMPAPEAAARAETFREAADRIVGESAIATKQARLDRLRLHVFPALGAKPVTQIVAGDVRAILDGLAKRFSRQQCLHVRNDISAVLGDLWRADMLPENVTKKVRVPKNAKVDRRERAVLTDEELGRYLAWKHPEPKKQSAVVERQTMAVLSRVFGGLRAGDVRSLRWEALDTENGRFAHGWAPRKKTARAQALEIGAVLRPYLRQWWELQGRPAAGLVFRVLTGKRAGEERKPGSIARALRRDLARAFGIEAPRAVVVPRSHGRDDFRLTWETARPMTARERELFAETEHTKPVDFHSFRRAFKQGLADAGVDVQLSMALSGATDLGVHQRYLANTAKARRVPDAALPSLGDKGTDDAFSSVPPHNTNGECSEFSECRRPDLNRRHHAYESLLSAENAGNHEQWFPATMPFLAGSDPAMPFRHAFSLPVDLPAHAADLVFGMHVRGVAERVAAELCQRKPFDIPHREVQLLD
jgi:integrase